MLVKGATGCNLNLLYIDRKVTQDTDLTCNILWICTFMSCILRHPFIFVFKWCHTFYSNLDMVKVECCLGFGEMYFYIVHAIYMKVKHKWLIILKSWNDFMLKAWPTSDNTHFIVLQKINTSVKFYWYMKHKYAYGHIIMISQRKHNWFNHGKNGDIFFSTQVRGWVCNKNVAPVNLDIFG